MELSPERQAEIKQLIESEEFNNITNPREQKLFCIDTLIMIYDGDLASNTKQVFTRYCPFCDFFRTKSLKVISCQDCPWEEQGFRPTCIDVACEVWRGIFDYYEWDDSSIASARLPMLWKWREFYTKLQENQP